MAKLPPKAFYILRIANRMRNAKHTLEAVEECIQQYLFVHFASAHLSEISKSFDKIKDNLNHAMDLLHIEYNYGASKNDSYIPIIMNRTAKSYFKMEIAESIRNMKTYLYDAKGFIIEYMKDNNIEGIDEIKDDLSTAYNQIDDVMNIIGVDENYGSPCGLETSFDWEVDEEEGDEYEYDYDNNNDNIDVLKSYCKEVFEINNCTDKNYSILIDESFENGMSDAIPVTLCDIARIRKNILIWADQYDAEEDEDADLLTCELFLINLKVEKEIHWEEDDRDNEDTYLPISSLLYLWYIIKDFQYYYQHHK